MPFASFSPLKYIVQPSWNFHLSRIKWMKLFNSLTNSVARKPLNRPLVNTIVAVIGSLPPLSSPLCSSLSRIHNWTVLIDVGNFYSCIYGIFSNQEIQNLKFNRHFPTVTLGKLLALQILYWLTATLLCGIVCSYHCQYKSDVGDLAITPITETDETNDWTQNGW